MNKKASLMLIIILLFVFLFVTNLFSQETQKSKQYARVIFDYHNAQWTFEELPTSDKPNAIFYSVFFNSFGVEGYEQYELIDSGYKKVSICKIYYNTNGQIEKWEIFNGQKISETCEFFYDENGNIIRIDQYEHKGMVVYLSKKHYYDLVRYKLEEYMFNKLIGEKFYWDNRQIKTEGLYIDNKKNGLWIYYNRYGQKISEEEYVKGEVVFIIKYEYGENSEKIKRITSNLKGEIQTTIYKYNYAISLIDPIEVWQYFGDEKTGTLLSVTIAEFDAVTSEFIAYVHYNSKCEIVSITIYRDEPGIEVKWIKITDPKKIANYLSSFNFEPSCRINP